SGSKGMGIPIFDTSTPILAGSAPGKLGHMGSRPGSLSQTAQFAQATLRKSKPEAGGQGWGLGTWSGI
ncbi:hypothetical protein, partial [Synechococcus sp. R55.8]|uniref:hypothetical protein n=1 Tax=Synechococcus sp. R55.8 TaxID=2964501 RepID=UPI0039C1C2D1